MGLFGKGKRIKTREGMKGDIQVPDRSLEGEDGGV